MQTYINHKQKHVIIIWHRIQSCALTTQSTLCVKRSRAQIPGGPAALAGRWVEALVEIRRTYWNLLPVTANCCTLVTATGRSCVCEPRSTTGTGWHGSYSTADIFYQQRKSFQLRTKFKLRCSWTSTASEVMTYGGIEICISLYYYYFNAFSRFKIVYFYHNFSVVLWRIEPFAALHRPSGTRCLKQ